VADYLLFLGSHGYEGTRDPAVRAV
jgi:hypothetical protein